MRRRPTIAVLAALGLAVRVGGAAGQEFAEGLRAYDAGDYGTAAEVWRELAEAGDPDARVALALLYRFGTGVPPDLGEAARLYERAAAQGSVDAQRNIGDLNARGAGVPRDPVAAYAWLTLAAEGGSAWAGARREEVARGMTAGQVAEARARAAELRRGFGG